MLGDSESSDWKTRVRKRPKNHNNGVEPKRIRWEDLPPSTPDIKESDIETLSPKKPKFKLIKWYRANPQSLYDYSGSADERLRKANAEEKYINRCICGEILPPHRQACGKFSCYLIDYMTYHETEEKINEFRLFIKKLNKINLNLNIKNIILEYLKPSCEVFEDRLGILEIQKSNYDKNSQKYKELNKEIKFLNQYK